LRDRFALVRGLAVGAWLGVDPRPGRDQRLPCEHSPAMSNRSVDGMRTYWDERAKENAAWYVDTSLSFDDPDMEQFWQQGERIVEIALDDRPARAPGRHELAVEIGSGLGRNCKALAARFDHVVGVDIAPEMVRRATELVPSATFELVDGASLAPVASASADFVFSFTVFQHIPDVAVIERYIEEAGRVLRPGGVFAFQWNNEAGHRRWKARRTLLTALQRTGLRRERYARHAPQFLGSKVPIERVEQALARGGLELAASRDLGSLYAWAWAVKP
jgi:SAM-dependent methyltransferase